MPLKDGDGGKTYNSKTELFAFSDENVNRLLPGSPFSCSLIMNRSRIIITKPFLCWKLPPRKTQIIAITLKVVSRIFAAVWVPVSTMHWKHLIQPKRYCLIPISDRFRNTHTASTVHKKLTLNCIGNPKLILYSSCRKKLYWILPAIAFKSDTIRFVYKAHEDYGSVVLRFRTLIFRYTRYPVRGWWKCKLSFSCYWNAVDQ